MNLASRGVFFERASAQNPAHCREPAMFLNLRVMLVVGDRLEIRGACELKHGQASWHQANLGQWSVEKWASVSFVQRTRKMP
jgi:hypothetical protein